MWDIMLERLRNLPSDPDVIRTALWVLVFLIGLWGISVRARIIMNIRLDIMYDSPKEYLALPPFKRMFWQLNKWSANSFKK